MTALAAAYSWPRIFFYPALRLAGSVSRMSLFRRNVSMCRFEDSHAFRNQAFAAPRMVAGRLLCQMVWRQAPCQPNSKRCPEPAISPSIPKRENLMKFQNCCLLLLLVVALAGGIRTVGQIALINLQLARCASSLLNGSCADGNLARDPHQRSSEHR